MKKGEREKIKLEANFVMVYLHIVMVELRVQLADLIPYPGLLGPVHANYFSFHSNPFFEISRYLSILN